jgi:hypothetical protein
MVGLLWRGEGGREAGECQERGTNFIFSTWSLPQGDIVTLELFIKSNCVTSGTKYF